MCAKVQDIEAGRPPSGLPPLGKASSAEDLLSPDALLNIGTGKPMPLGEHRFHSACPRQPMQAMLQLVCPHHPAAGRPTPCCRACASVPNGL